MVVHAHSADGTDERGRGLLITIRIAPDGTTYFHDLTADLLPVASALAPGASALLARAEIAARFGQEPTNEHDPDFPKRPRADKAAPAPPEE